jgi:hypothetical protein
MWGSNPAAVSAKFTRWSSQRSIHIGLLDPFSEFIDDVEFVSSQNAERGAEAALAPKLNIVDFSLDQADFYDTAALISNLDLVISDLSIASRRRYGSRNVGSAHESPRLATRQNTRAQSLV